MRKQFKVFRGERAVVTELVKGQALSATYDGETVVFSEPVHTQIGPFVEKQLKALYDDMKEMLQIEHDTCDELEAKGAECNRPDIEVIRTITIKGVLCGGLYEHPDVPKLIGVGNLSGTHDYCQDNQFLAFDLLINDELQDFYSMASMCVSFGIPTVPTLFFGNPKACDKFCQTHPELNTNVTQLFPLLDGNGDVWTDSDGMWASLPDIEDNAVAGFVVRAVTPVKGQNVEIII